MESAGAAKQPTQKIISAHILKTKYDLWPLLGMVGLGCVLATVYSAYSLVQKPDVRVSKKSGIVPWEEVNPEKPQKLYDINKSKYQRIPEVEQLRREIGSYQCK